MSHSLREICNDRSRCTSLLLHSSTFALTFRYFTHTLPKDVAPNSLCSFSENYFLNCFKPKYQAAEWLQSKPLVSLSSPITRSYSSQCLGQHRLFQGRQREESRMRAVCHVSQSFTKVYDCVSRHCCLETSGVAFPPPHSCKDLRIETEQKGLYGGKSPNEPAL